MSTFLDTLMLVGFILFLVFIFNGYNKQRANEMRDDDTPLKD